ncbi:enoyl-CoA hydratase [Litchfieldia salsa]|uniref:Enoyl-CoA hydratase n=1 Tax=Litchfieldia salsa TaxID=930152 RepID=A0A1H0NYV0_9BACI|nr:enoyl-CoA hydratase [Litchfieldia salsa]SDO97718.1 enoyl-CoA hydratase [Litchfieldia salsa]
MEYLQLKIEDQIAVISINRPPANALSSQVLKGLTKLLDEIENNDEVRVIVIHGEGRFFSAGADIKEFTSLRDESDYAALAKSGQDIFERFEQFPKPIIACIHGAALGGGLELALGCHIRIVSEDAKLGLPELQLGIIPGFGGSVRLPRYVGVAKAAEMFWTSDHISGLDAVRLGLANHAFNEEDLLEETLKIARKIALKSPITLAATIELLNLAKKENFHGVVDREAQLFSKVFSTEDSVEGIQAFLEKRKPIFKGK